MFPVYSAVIPVYSRSFIDHIYTDTRKKNKKGPVTKLSSNSDIALGFKEAEI